MKAKKKPIRKKSTSNATKVAKSGSKTKSPTSQKDLQKLFEADFNKLITKEAKRKPAPAKKPSTDLQKLFEQDFNKLISKEASKTPSRTRREAPEKRKGVPTGKVTGKPAKAAKTAKQTVRKSYIFDAEKPVANVNLDKARKGTIRKNKQTVYAKRNRLKKKLESAQNEKERKAALNEIYRTSRWLEKANERLGKKKKKAGYTQKVIAKGKKQLQRNVNLWDAGKAIDQLVDSGEFKTFIVNGQRFRASEVMDIMEEFDNMHEEGALMNDYFVEIHQDSNTGTITIDLPQPSNEDE